MLTFSKTTLESFEIDIVGLCTEEFIIVNSLLGTIIQDGSIRKRSNDL